MEKVFITGHRNPDMDSVCSAYGYSVLKNRIDKKREYVPCRLGPVSKAVENVFENAGASIPSLLSDVRLRVSDIMKRNYVRLDVSNPVYDVIKLYNKKHPSVIPIFDGDKFICLLSSDDINRYFLLENHAKGRPFYTVSESNIQRCIPGYYFKKGRKAEVKSQFVVGAMEYDVFKSRVEECDVKPVLIVGLRKRHIQYAIDSEMPGIVLTGINDIKSLSDFDFSSYKGFVYISALDTAETIKLLRLSSPVKRIIRRDKAITIKEDTLFDEALEILIKSEERGLAVLDESSTFTGYVTRRCFLSPEKKKVIMVDHNEAEQSVLGIEGADILEIIDHHRLDAPKMASPIFISSEPLGSTCTIVYEMYKKYGVRLDEKTAYILLAGVTSDTVMLKSPTTTDYDRFVVKKLLKIAKVPSYEDFGYMIFSSSSNLREEDPEKIILQDYKPYSENRFRFAISQVEVSSLLEIRSVEDIYIKALEAIRDKNGFDFVCLLATDVFAEKSVLLTTPFARSYRLSYKKESEGVYYLPGVLSRKKQLLPEIIKTLSD